MSTRGRPGSRTGFVRTSPRFNDGRGSRSSEPLMKRSQFSNGDVEEELASKTVYTQTKRFYVDIKQNKNGKFVKITEVNTVGRKKRVVLSMSTAAIFRDQLVAFTDYCSNLGPKPANHPSENDTLKSEVINREERRYYYLDLKENSRGRYLRVCMTMPLSRQRFHIAIPTQVMAKLGEVLSELLNEFGTEEGDGFGLPGPKTMKVENKLFYFDVGRNKNGVFMRISEVRNNFRTAITLPDKCWSRFRDLLSEFAQSVSTQEESRRATITRQVDEVRDGLERVSIKKMEVEMPESASCMSLAGYPTVVSGIADSASEALAIGSK